MVAVFCVLGFGKPAVAVAAEEREPQPGDRLQQLERRINELAQRQEQVLRRFDARRDQQAQPAPQWRMPRQGRLPAPPPNLENPRRPLPAAGMPAPEMLKARKGLHDLIGLIVLIGIICNILLAIWIFTDIRKRGEGSGIFIALALVAGIPTAIIYALVRIGDKKA
jgi:hypothetical protein